MVYSLALNYDVTLTAVLEGGKESEDWGGLYLYYWSDHSISLIFILLFVPNLRNNWLIVPETRISSATSCKFSLLYPEKPTLIISSPPLSAARPAVSTRPQLWALWTGEQRGRGRGRAPPEILFGVIILNTNMPANTKPSQLSFTPAPLHVESLDESLASSQSQTGIPDVDQSEEPQHKMINGLCPASGWTKCGNWSERASPLVRILAAWCPGPRGEVTNLFKLLN